MAGNSRVIDSQCESAEKISDGQFRFRYKWPLNYNDFEARKKSVGEPLISPIFSTGSNNELRWYMKMYPKGVNECNKNNVSLYVCYVPSTLNSKVQATVKLSILNELNKIFNVNETSNTHTFAVGTENESSRLDNYSGGFKRSLLFDIDFFNVYTFTIVCELNDALKMSDVHIPEHQILDSLQTFFESKKFSDVTLMISGQAIRAHKIILALYSPVFLAMFEHEMKEQMHNEVEISDITPDVFNELLRFMYTGEVQDIERIADFLLVAANKYAVDRLKAMCEDALCKHTDIENAADMLILADEHNADQLKSGALKFIVSWTRNVMTTPGFQSMAKSHPHLVVAVLHELVVSGGQKAVC